MMTGTREILSDVFGDYRWEWRNDQFGDLFVRPSYFEALQSARPSFLIGGRGTGKTTALKSLRFDAPLSKDSADERGYLGIYIRINKNRVRAFHGQGIAEDLWSRAFAHYFNLLACLELCRLAAWLSERGALAIAPDALERQLNLICRSLCVPEARNILELSQGIRGALLDLETWVNNAHRREPPVLSLAESPLRQFVELFELAPGFEGKMLHCCVDEYENLLQYQQSVLNTYIKHAERPLSYKIGVRRYGIWSRQTTDSQDLLRTPDDYSEIDISADHFADFATKVAELRLDIARDRGAKVPASLKELLPEYSRAEEAVELGARRIADAIREKINQTGDQGLNEWQAGIADHDLYLLEYWRESTKKSDIVTLARDWLRDGKSWRTRIENYGYTSLFWLSKGRKGVRVRKYYCGHRTFLALALGNIRYFLELIDTSIEQHFKEDDREPSALVLSQRVQTEAARLVGRRRLDQLEGLSESGSDLKRLLLGTGKVFFEFARNPEGHTPEVTHFVLVGDVEARREVEALLKEGVSHLAFEATPKTKATSDVEMRDNEYRIHPIFAPFFEISTRRKRRASFDADLLRQLKVNPRQAIAGLMGGRLSAPDEELPEQIAMFSAFFQGGPK